MTATTVDAVDTAQNRRAVRGTPKRIPLTRVVSVLFTGPQCFMNMYPLTGQADVMHGMTHNGGGTHGVSHVIAWHMKHFAYLMDKLRTDALIEDTAAVTDWSFVKPGDTDLIAQPLDLLGVNYYSTVTVRMWDGVSPRVNADGHKDMGGTPWPGSSGLSSDAGRTGAVHGRGSVAAADQLVRVGGRSRRAGHDTSGALTGVPAGPRGRRRRS